MYDLEQRPDLTELQLPTCDLAHGRILYSPHPIYKLSLIHYLLMIWFICLRSFFFLFPVFINQQNNLTEKWAIYNIQL